MKRERRVSKHAPNSLNWVAMVDLDYEVNEVKHSVTMTIYQCPNSKEYVIFFEPEENVLVIGKDQEFEGAGNNLRDNLINYYRKK